MSSLPPLLPQGSAPLNCHMPPLPPSPSIQQHSTVKFRSTSTTQLSYVPLFSLKGQHSRLKGQHHSTVTTTMSYFPPTTKGQPSQSIKGQHHSFTICPPCRLLPQSSAPLNCPHLCPLPSKGQHHSTVISPPSTHFSLKGQHMSLNCHMFSPSTTPLLLPQSNSTVSTPAPSKVSITQLSYVNQRSAPLNCHMCAL